MAVTSGGRAEALEPIDMHIGRRVGIAREARGLRRETVAQQVGVSWQMLEKYERGYTRLYASRLYAIAQLLEVPVAWFFEDFAYGKSPPPVDFQPVAPTLRPEDAAMLELYRGLNPEQKRLLRLIASEFEKAQGGAADGTADEEEEEVVEA